MQIDFDFSDHLHERDRCAFYRGIGRRSKSFLDRDRSSVERKWGERESRSQINSWWNNSSHCFDICAWKYRRLRRSRCRLSQWYKYRPKSTSSKYSLAARRTSIRRTCWCDMQGWLLEKRNARMTQKHDVHDDSLSSKNRELTVFFLLFLIFPRLSLSPPLSLSLVRFAFHRRSLRILFSDNHSYLFSHQLIDIPRGHRACLPSGFRSELESCSASEWKRNRSHTSLLSLFSMQSFFSDDQNRIKIRGKKGKERMPVRTN